MFGLSGIPEQLIHALSQRASLASRIFSAWADIGPDVSVGPQELTNAAQLSRNQEFGTAEILSALRDLNLLIGKAPSWKPKPELAKRLSQLAQVFSAIEIYQTSVHRDATGVRIVATRPARALALDREIEAAGWQTPRPEETDETIADLFACAKKSIVVMTPFLDAKGGPILQSLLLHGSEDVEITVILRYLYKPDRLEYPKGFGGIRGWLRDRGARVFNYSLEHPSTGQVETFHAKLFLADRSRAYVGSANMTGSSFGTSVELGVVLEGDAARQLSRLVDAVLQCARPWPLE